MASIISTLNAGGKRAKTHDAQIVFKLPARAKETVRRAGNDQGVSDGAICRRALAEYFEKRGYLS